MEIAKVELAAVECALAAKETEVKELQDLELSLIGGGMGDIVLV